MNLIFLLLKTAWRAVAIALLTGFISGGCSAGLIALISHTMTRSAPPTRPIILAFVGLGGVALTLSMVSRILLVRFSQATVFKLQLHLSRQILATELKPLETLGLPRLLAILTEDIQAIATAVATLPVLIINIAGAAGCMIYIAWLSWRVLVLVLLITIVASVSCRWFLVEGRRWLAAAREQQDLLFQHFRSLIAGIKELKLHTSAQQDFFQLDLTRTALQVKQLNQRGFSLFAILDSWGKFIYFFAVGLVLFALPRWIGISPETRFGYVLTFTYLLGPMETLVNKLPLLGQASVALEKLRSLNLEPAASLTANPTASATAASATPAISPTGRKLADSWQQLSFKALTHTYRTDQGEDEFTLGPIDLSVHPGELLFVVGGNGSGKSTLAKLITGLYAPQSGSILLNNEQINHKNREWYRQHFAAVFADFYLFDRLLGTNNSVDDSKAQEYLQKLQLSHKVSVKNGKFSTLDLSQGQQKRIALLRAYLENRPIYLFDEWAADQDPTFKQIFYTQFLPELRAQGKTIFVISHDDRYFHLGDRLIKLNYGQIES